MWSDELVVKSTRRHLVGTCGACEKRENPSEELRGATLDFIPQSIRHELSSDSGPSFFVTGPDSMETVRRYCSGLLSSVLSVQLCHALSPPFVTFGLVRWPIQDRMFCCSPDSPQRREVLPVCKTERVGSNLGTLLSPKSKKIG